MVSGAPTVKPQPLEAQEGVVVDQQQQEEGVDEPPMEEQQVSEELIPDISPLLSAKKVCLLKHTPYLLSSHLGCWVLTK
jgi:hypothetical protein